MKGSGSASASVERSAKGLQFSEDLLSAANEGNAKSQYNLGACYFQGLGVETDSSLGILWLARASRSEESAQEMLNFRAPAPSHLVSVYKDSNNTPLSASEILEVFSAEALQERISENSSHLIGDLVEVSKSSLSAAEILKIYGAVANTKGLDATRSKSCKIIADCWAEKLGQEIGITGKELKEIKVLNRDADSVECQFPSGEGLSTSSSASAAFSSWIPSFLRRPAVPQKSPLGASSISNESSPEERMEKLTQKIQSADIAEFTKGRETLLVKASVRKASLALQSGSSSSVATEPSGFVTNPMLASQPASQNLDSSRK